MSRPAVAQIVAIHAGDHDVAQPHRRGHPRDIGRLFRIERARMAALRHRTESAAARAQIAQDHERRRAAVETLVHVRAARRFAHGVQIQPPQLGFQIVDGFEMRVGFAQPFGQPRLRT